MNRDIQFFFNGTCLGVIENSEAKDISCHQSFNFGKTPGHLVNAHRDPDTTEKPLNNL